jgi:hypothetical protein
MDQTDLALDLDPLRSLSEAAFIRTEMDIRSILSHELVVGDYLGVISSLHHPDHFRRVEKLEYVDADLGRHHLRNDVFYLEAAGMGPVIAWCHGIAGPLILPAGDVHIWLDVPQDRRTADEKDVYWGVLSGRGCADVHLLAPTRPDGHLAAAPNPGRTGVLATRLAREFGDSSGFGGCGDPVVS